MEAYIKAAADRVELRRQEMDDINASAKQSAQLEQWMVHDAERIGVEVEQNKVLDKISDHIEAMRSYNQYVCAFLL